MPRNGSSTWVYNGSSVAINDGDPEAPNICVFDRSCVAGRDSVGPILAASFDMRKTLDEAHSLLQRLTNTYGLSASDNKDARELLDKAWKLIRASAPKPVLITHVVRIMHKTGALTYYISMGFNDKEQAITFALNNVPQKAVVYLETLENGSSASYELERRYMNNGTPPISGFRRVERLEGDAYSNTVFPEPVISTDAKNEWRVLTALRQAESDQSHDGDDISLTMGRD